MLRFPSLSASLLTLLAFFSPTTTTTTLPTSRSTLKTWTITRLDYHYMTLSPGFGPPTMPWPATAIFPTTLSLDISIPDAHTEGGAWNASCEMSWANGSLPEESVACLGEGGMGQVWVGIREWQIPGKAVPEGSPREMPFMLGVGRMVDGEDLDEGETWQWGNVTVSCDDPSSPSSYLTCLTGRPLDGMRCKLHEMNNINLSNMKEMQIEPLAYCGPTGLC